MYRGRGVLPPGPDPACVGATDGARGCLMASVVCGRGGEGAPVRGSCWQWCFGGGRRAAGRIESLGLILFVAAVGAGCGTELVNTGVDPGDGGIKSSTANVPERCLRPDGGANRAVGEACECPNDCATGACVRGRCDVQKPNGMACESGSQCDSGFCGDGVCCEVACGGPCVSCNLPGRAGTCTPVPAGERDVHGVCKTEPPSSCGQTGFCNGLGGCARFMAGTVCRPQSCQGREQVLAPSQCDGDGACVPGGTVSCAPSACDGTACLASCTGNDQCTGPASAAQAAAGPGAWDRTAPRTASADPASVWMASAARARARGRVRSVPARTPGGAASRSGRGRSISERPGARPIRRGSAATWVPPHAGPTGAAMAPVDASCTPTAPCAARPAATGAAMSSRRRRPARPVPAG
jgi:hypothetical protein